MIEFIMTLIMVTIAYEDFRHRAVRFLFFPILLVAFITKKLTEYQLEVVAVNSIINLSYLAFLFGTGFLIIHLRYKRTISQISQSMGWGDIFLMLAIACWFDPVSFIIFNVFSLVAALVFHLAFRRFTLFYNNVETVPLAGVQSICFLIVFISRFYSIQ